MRVRLYFACYLYVCVCVCVTVYVCILRVLWNTVCWRRAPRIGQACLLPQSVLFANINPAPLEGHAHASKSNQGTHLRTGRLHSRRSRERGCGPYAYGSSRDPKVCARDVRTWSAAKNHTMNSEAAVAILASDSLAQVAVSCQHAQSPLSQSSATGVNKG